MKKAWWFGAWEPFQRDNTSFFLLPIQKKRKPKWYVPIQLVARLSFGTSNILTSSPRSIAFKGHFGDNLCCLVCPALITKYWHCCYRVISNVRQRQVAVWTTTSRRESSAASLQSLDRCLWILIYMSLSTENVPKQVAALTPKLLKIPKIQDIYLYTTRQIPKYFF